MPSPRPQVSAIGSPSSTLQKCSNLHDENAEKVCSRNNSSSSGCAPSFAPSSIDSCSLNAGGGSIDCRRTTAAVLRCFASSSSSSDSAPLQPTIQRHLASPKLSGSRTAAAAALESAMKMSPITATAATTAVQSSCACDGGSCSLDLLSIRRCNRLRAQVHHHHRQQPSSPAAFSSLDSSHHQAKYQNAPDDDEASAVFDLTHCNSNGKNSSSSRQNRAYRRVAHSSFSSSSSSDDSSSSSSSSSSPPRSSLLFRSATAPPPSTTTTSTTTTTTAIIMSDRTSCLQRLLPRKGRALEEGITFSNNNNNHRTTTTTSTSSPSPSHRQLYFLLYSLLIIFSTVGLKVSAQIAHHQYFKVSPQSEVDVIEGSTLLLQCVVGNQRGPVQWAKDGFVLGYDRSIPGYPRYSMIGDASLGVHNLRIVDAKSEDNGEFQCQVGPGGKNYAPIRATSKVTVLIPPHSIEIIAPANGKSTLKNASHVELQEGSSVTIECLVTGGKPPAQIKWFRKSVELRSADTTKTETSTLTTLIDSNSIHDAETVVYSSKSTITVSGNAEDNGVPYSCEAVHKALTGRPLRRTVSLSVLYPPGEPEISGYVEGGEPLKVGDTLKLDCRARGGNPLAQLVWFRNDEQVDFSYTTVAGKYSVNTLEFTVEARDNAALYRCVATSPIVERPMKRETRLQVFYGPTKLTISSAKEVRAGDVVPVSCRTEPSNPAARINWVVDGRPVAANASTVEPVAPPSGGFITTANITIPITEKDRNMKMLSCYAVNEKISETIVESSVLNVLYPPESIHIFGYEESRALQHDTVQRLTCVCKGGNPLCSPKWFKAEREVSEGTQVSVNGNTVTNELVFRVDPSDNGATYKCTGENSASSVPIKAMTTITVHFPPSKVSIKLTPKQPVAGAQLDILCETGSSNPESEVSWWRDGFSLEGHKEGVVEGLYGGKATRDTLKLNVSSADDGTVITCQAKNKVLGQSVHDAITLNIQYPPEFVNPPLTQFDIDEGQSNTFNQTARGNPSAITYKWRRENDSEIRQQSESSSGANRIHRITADGPVLNLTNAQRTDSGIYKLYATNELGTSETSIRVNVQYPAVIKKTSELVLVEVGANAHFECLVDANPVNEQVITWKRRKNDSESSVPSSSSSSSSSYDKSDDSEESSSSSSVFNRMRTDVEVFNQGEENGGVFSSNFGGGVPLKGTLVVLNASLADSGTSFDCLADNGVGKRSKATMTLLVLHQPVIDRSPLISKAASESGHAVKLICRAQGTPNVTFTWKREGSVIKPQSSSSSSSSESSSSSSSSKSKKTSSSSSPKYLIEETRQLDLITYQSELQISDVSAADYGAYDCVARNDLGFDALAIVLNRTAPPDAPRDLRKLNVTSGSVTLRWVAGFDGGLGQSFRVRYRPVMETGGSLISGGGDPSYMYRDVFPTNSTTATVGSLRDSTEYVFSVMASNSKGDSEYTEEVRAATLKESAITETEKIVAKVQSELAGIDFSRLIVSVTLVGGALLLFNIVLVVCFVRKRKRKRYEEESDGYSGGTDSKTTASSKATLELYETTTNGTKPSTVSLNHLSLGGHHNGGSSNGGGSSSNNSNNNNHKGGITETSLSGGEDELISNKSEDRFSGQTDYEMEIPPASMMTGFDHHHHHLNMLPSGLHIQTSLPHHGTMRGMSTYLLDESTTTAVSNHHQQMAAMSATSPMHSQQQQQQQQFQQQYHHQFHPPLPTSTTTLRYSSLGSDIGGPTSFYNAIASEEDYLSALQQSAGTTLLTTATGQLAALNSQSNDVLSNSPYGNLADLHHHHHQAYMVATSGAGAGDVLTANGGMSNGGLVPPLPPLRSLMPGGGNSNGAAGGGGGSMSTFLPAISEEPAVTPIGHLV